MEEKIKNRIKYLIEFGQKVVASKHGDTYPLFVEKDLFYEFKVSSLSFLRTVFKEDHPIYIEFLKVCVVSKLNDADKGLAILKAASSEIEEGWLSTLNELVSADIFSDFLEMAEYLLKQKYKDPAAVIIGSVLEEQLRKLCEKNEISTFEDDGKSQFKKADRLNSELYSKTVYNKLDNKSVTTWLDLRNKAAHGSYGEYTIEQVNLMYQGVRDFIIRVK